MNFWEKVTGSDITSAMQSYAERMYGLSEDYAAVWDEIVRCLYAYTDFTGRNILPVLDGWPLAGSSGSGWEKCAGGTG